MAWASKRIILSTILTIGIGSAFLVGHVVKDSRPDETEGKCQTTTAEAKRLASLATGGMAGLAVKSRSESLPILTFNDPEGQPTTLATFQGKALLLNLWATWCAPCREEMPTLNTLERDFGGKTFAVVAINVDTRATDRPRQWLKENAIDALPYYSDSTGNVLKTLQRSGHAPGLPATILVGSKGCEIATLLGGADWASPEGRSIIQTLISPSTN